MITDLGLDMLMDRFLTAGTYTQLSKFKVGNNNTTPSTTDTDLAHAIPITGTEQVDDCETADWADSADMTTSLNSTTYKQGSNGLNLIKDGTASATASTSKTTTSLDFTSKELSVWFYVVDSAALAKLATTSCLEIRFGSDSSNYYSWLKDNSDLTTGWNLVDGLTSSNANSTTGTPVLAAMDYSYLGLTATGTAIVWSAGDMVMDDWKLVSSDDILKIYESGYPLINVTTKEIIYRMLLSSTEANGYNLKEMGLFNTDSPPTIWNRDIFTSISKSDTEEVRVIIKDRFSAN